jgi:hypothetical protein
MVVLEVNTAARPAYQERRDDLAGARLHGTTWARTTGPAAGQAGQASRISHRAVVSQADL